MEDISLHILDIVENSIKAGASFITIKIKEDLINDLLTVEIIDNGIGIDKDEIKKVTDPFYTTGNKKVGLGLSLLKQAVEEANGELIIDSEKGKGTKIKATFIHSHINRKPIGNIADTLITLIAGHPNIDFVYEHERTGSPTYRLDTREIKKILKDMSINTPVVLGAIRNDILSNDVENNV
ncbi:MAG: ATP-binding protein [Nitrospirae bacterium]|nr:MAG: ATP-binding protein [Nitrospirota bacterium]